MDTLRRTLTFIREKKPSEENLRQWFFDRFPKVLHEGATRGFIRTTLWHSGLVDRDKKGHFLTQAGEEYLENPDNTLLFNILDEHVLGFKETLEIISELEPNIEELGKELSKKLSLTWKAAYGQPYWRVTWLRSMGFVTLEGSIYRLTKAGRTLLSTVPTGQPRTEVRKTYRQSENADSNVIDSIIANITWNPHGWRRIYVDRRAGHEYARSKPGHESLNFRFDKAGIDNEKYLYGYFQYSRPPRLDGGKGFVFFYTKDLDDGGMGKIVGVYGQAEIVEPEAKHPHPRFSEKVLVSNLRANPRLSCRFDTYLPSEKYLRMVGKKRVGRVGFTRINPRTARTILEDEIRVTSGSDRSKLKDIYSVLLGKETLPVQEPEHDEPLFPEIAGLKEFTVKPRGVSSRQFKRTIRYIDNQVARERASKEHQRLVGLLRRKLSQGGLVPKNNKHIDVATQLGKEVYIFEAKSTHQNNYHDQIRRAISQLYEYRYIQCVPNAKLCIVTSTPPPSGEKWLIEFLINDRRLLICWAKANAFECPSTSRGQLRFVVD